jgi:hypothetical protein
MNEEAIQRKDIPVGVIAGPFEKSHGIPKGWIVCDGNNGTPNLTPSALANMAEIKKKKDKEFAYIMKVEETK